MKFIITESQKEYVWILRRLEDPNIIAKFEDILSEGLWDEFSNICEYNFEGGKESFIHDTIEGSIYTFILTYQMEMIGDFDIEKREWYGDLFNYLIDKMKNKYGDKLSSYYDEHIKDC